MKTNIKAKSADGVTHEGGIARKQSPEQALKHSVLACLLWENNFYEFGEEIAERITRLVGKVSPGFASGIAIDARNAMKIRHVPLLIVRAMLDHPAHKRFVKQTLAEVIQRPDEITEFLALYFQGEKKPVPAQVKKGIAQAFTKFDEYQLAKYNRKASVTLKDAIFLCHPKPIIREEDDYGTFDIVRDHTTGDRKMVTRHREGMGGMWRRLVNDQLATPDTWEVALSSGKDKMEAWTTLLRNKKLPPFALLKNLRNMREAGVGTELIASAIGEMNVERILPFRFITAAKYCPELEEVLEQAMFRALSGMDGIEGKTTLLIDVSGSMSSPIANRSDTSRMDAACGLAILARTLCEEVEIYTFSEKIVQVPARAGFALRDAIIHSQDHSRTFLGKALKSIPQNHGRLIVFTDEQSHDAVPDMPGYMVNVASYERSVTYGAWTNITGFSEGVLKYIQVVEEEG